MRRGVIYGLSFDGLGYIKDVNNNELFSFTLDRVEGYRGQKLESFKPNNGSTVEFTCSGSEVESVRAAVTLPKKKLAVARAKA